jgi:hypothetical protein
LLVLQRFIAVGSAIASLAPVDERVLSARSRFTSGRFVPGQAGFRFLIDLRDVAPSSCRCSGFRFSTFCSLTYLFPVAFLAIADHGESVPLFALPGFADLFFCCRVFILFLSNLVGIRRCQVLGNVRERRKGLSDGKLI